MDSLHHRKATDLVTDGKDDVAKRKTDIKIEYVKINSLNPFIGNPRKISDDELTKLCRSLKEFGFVDPVIARKSDRMVIGGHQRLVAADKLGWTDDIPVVFLDGISDERAAMLNVALNKISGEWDWSGLGDLFGELDTGDIDLELSGFDKDEIGKLMSGLDESAGKSLELTELWQVVCECKNEKEQQKLYERLSKEGLSCRLLIL